MNSSPKWAFPSPSRRGAPRGLIPLFVLLLTMMSGAVVNPGSAGEAAESDDYVHSPGLGGELYSVSAVSRTESWAVGTYFAERDGPSRPLNQALHFVNGTWRKVHVPTPAEGGVLNSVYAGKGRPIAVGWAFRASSYQRARAAIIRWDGTHWQSERAGLGESYQSFLNAVDGTAADDLWAVGHVSHNVMGRGQTLIEHWNGQRWEVMHSPGPGRGATLNSVDVLRTDDVWAAGHFYRQGGSYAPLLVHWNGNEWTRLRIPMTRYQYATLKSVSGTSADDVWIAGLYGIGRDTRPLLLHWDGHHVNVMHSPVPDKKSTIISSVLARASDDLWAVGSLSPGQDGPLIEHWDGKHWKVYSGLDGTSDRDTLFAVAALGPHGLLAVGRQFPDDLVFEWDGQGWHRD